VARAHRAFCLAAFSIQSCLAFTGVSVYAIYTFKARIFTRVALTLININATINTCEARHTDAFVFQESWSPVANPIGRTLMFNACVIEEFTVYAHVGYRLHGADAPVTPFQILTAPTIFTRG